MTQSHDSKEFFIDEKMILVSPTTVQDSIAGQTMAELVASGNYTEIGKIDFPVESTLGEYGSIDSEKPISAVFTARLETAKLETAKLETAKLETAKLETTGSNHTTDVLPIGIAIYVQNPITLTHELSILVQPDYANTRLPLELLDSLVLDAAENGALTLSTTDTNDDVHMRAIADKTGMSVRLDNKHYRHTRYTLQVDKHPGVVMF
jgi:hypothetical protein